MPGETQLHKTLKKEACRWLWRNGYRCVAAEVRLPPLGIVDAVGSGSFGAFDNHLKVGKRVSQSCIVECKASRSDFLRDLSDDGQLSLALMERRGNRCRQGRRTLRQRLGLGKFDACVAQPVANLHYILAPVGIIQKKDLPPRWGLLTYGEAGITVVVKACWQEQAKIHFVETAIAHTLTGDIYRADDRAMQSVNREIISQQTRLAEKIRELTPVMIEKNIDRPAEPMVDPREAMLTPSPNVNRLKIDRAVPLFPRRKVAEA